MSFIKSFVLKLTIIVLYILIVKIGNKILFIALHALNKQRKQKLIISCLVMFKTYHACIHIYALEF